MKKLIAMLGLAASLSLTIPCFSETREQLGLPAKGVGTLIEHAFNVDDGIYVRHLDTTGNGVVYNLEEIYPIVGGESPMYTLSDNPVAMWFDKNGNEVPDPDEIFNSPKADENWMTHVKYLEMRKQQEEDKKSQEQQKSDNPVDPSQIFSP